MKKKILIYGVGSFKNRGIEALVQSTLKQIDLDKYKVSIASHDYNYDKNFYTDMVDKYIKHYKKTNELSEEEKILEEKYKNEKFNYDNFELLYQNEVVKELETSNICISIGGDNYCYDHCTWLYSLDKKSHQSDKKTILWGASLFEEITDLELINNLNNFDVLVIRESITYNAIKKFIPEEKLILTVDPAFGLPIKNFSLNKWYKNKKYVVINISPLTIKTKDQFQGVINLINYILKNTTYSICLLPHVVTDDCNDLEGLRRLKEVFNNEKRIYLEEGNFNCNELKYIISKSVLSVVARTHASIAAYSTCVPTLVIGYSVKSKGIAKDIFGNYDDYVISAHDVKDDSLVKKFIFIDENKSKIKKILEEKMPNYIIKAKNIFKEVLEKLANEEQLKICSKDKCIGCGICSLKCPKKAITMEEDENGYLYPKIDLTKCINCNLCRDVCPINKHQERENFTKEYYAIKNKNIEQRKKSTSGGVASIIAEKVLDAGGVVYGCQMDNFKIKHIRIDKKEDLFKIRGSKYVQSNILEVLPFLQKDLEEKRIVLFSGTPCQIGAIKNFLNADYNNLLTIAVVCHGVLNQNIFDKYLNELEQEKNGKIENFTFRSKEKGWKTSSIEYKINGEKYVKPFTEDALMYLYLKDLITRKSCYYCQYKESNNIADFILGDYWGIEITNPEFFDNNGVSCLIINTQKGKEFFEKINFKKFVFATKGNHEDIVKYNPQLTQSIKEPKERVLILRELKENSFNLICANYKNLLEKKDLEEKNNELTKQNEKLTFELTKIYNSKRWKVTDKVFNTINKFFHKK